MPVKLIVGGGFRPFPELQANTLGVCDGIHSADPGTDLLRNKSVAGRPGTSARIIPGIPRRENAVLWLTYRASLATGRTPCSCESRSDLGCRLAVPHTRPPRKTRCPCRYGWMQKHLSCKSQGRMQVTNRGPTWLPNLFIISLTGMVRESSNGSLGSKQCKTGATAAANTAWLGAELRSLRRGSSLPRAAGSVFEPAFPRHALPLPTARQL